MRIIDLSKIVLRSATMKDADAIASVYLISRNELVAFAPLVHSDESVKSWVRDVLIPSEQVFVAEDAQMIVGMMSLKNENGFGWITQLYILPSAIRRGIGSLMLEKAKSILGSPIRIYTFQENHAARQFYERHGFLAIEFNGGLHNEEHCPDILYEWKV